MGHSYRNFDPDDFDRRVDRFRHLREKSENKEAAEVQKDLRAELKFIEDGRFHAMLDAAHRMMSALDRDEVELFKERNPRLVRWVNIFAVAEDLRTF